VPLRRRFDDDGRNWAFRDAEAAVDACICVDVVLLGTLVDAIDWADDDAGLILFALFGNHVRHGSEFTSAQFET
jgi:hypothetical protein